MVVPAVAVLAVRAVVPCLQFPAVVEAVVRSAAGDIDGAVDSDPDPCDPAAAGWLWIAPFRPPASVAGRYRSPVVQRLPVAALAVLMEVEVALKTALEFRQA